MDINDKLLSETQLQELKQAFSIIDNQNQGYINSRDLKIVLRALGFEPKNEEIKELIGEFANEPSKIDFSEFVNMMYKKMFSKDEDSEAFKAFRLLDIENNGFITESNLIKVCKELGENLSQDELREMILEADRDGDGVVNQEDFLFIMKKTNLY